MYTQGLIQQDRRGAQLSGPEYTTKPTLTPPSQTTRDETAPEPAAITPSHRWTSLPPSPLTMTIFVIWLPLGVCCTPISSSLTMGPPTLKSELIALTLLLSSTISQVLWSKCPTSALLLAPMARSGETAGGLTSV